MELTPRHIGIIGGMGPQATVTFLKHVLTQAHDAHGARRDHEYPRMSIESIQVPSLTAEGINDMDVTGQAIKEALHTLEARGVEVVAIPCNTIHVLYDELSKSTNIPILNIVEETSDAAAQSSAKRAFVLGSGTTRDSNLYTHSLTARGMEALYPSEVSQQRAEELITILEEGIATDEAQKLYASLIEEAVSAGADCLILGCTELSILPRSETPLTVVDSAKILAERLTAHAYQV